MCARRDGRVPASRRQTLPALYLNMASKNLNVNCNIIHVDPDLRQTRMAANTAVPAITQKVRVKSEVCPCSSPYVFSTGGTWPFRIPLDTLLAE